MLVLDSFRTIQLICTFMRMPGLTIAVAPCTCMHALLHVGWLLLREGADLNVSVAWRGCVAPGLDAAAMVQGVCLSVVCCKYGLEVGTLVPSCVLARHVCMTIHSLEVNGLV